MERLKTSKLINDSAVLKLWQENALKWIMYQELNICQSEYKVQNSCVTMQRSDLSDYGDAYIAAKGGIIVEDNNHVSRRNKIANVQEYCFI